MKCVRSQRVCELNLKKKKKGVLNMVFFSFYFLGPAQFIEHFKMNKINTCNYILYFWDLCHIY